MIASDMWQVASSGGTLGLAIIFLYLFQSGKVRSEKQLVEAVAVYTKVIELKDTELAWWRAAYQQQVERGDSQEQLNRQQLELSKTSLAVIEGLQAAAKRAAS